MISLIKKDICSSINKGLGLTETLTDEAIDGIQPTRSDGYRGVFGYAGNRVLGDNMSALAGQQAGCASRGFSSGGTFYMVIDAR
jgi:hypothetical protein